MGLKTRTPFSINRNNMGKTCLNKLGSNIVVDCEIPTVGITELYLMHVEDVTFSETQGSWVTVAFAEGTKSYRIEGYKQNIQVTMTNRSLEASNKLDISVSFKTPHSFGSGTSMGTAFLRAILTGRFYVLVVGANGRQFIAGSQSPLECTGFDWDSNANGQYRTITLTAPDGSAGNYITDIVPAAATIIKTKA